MDRHEDQDRRAGRDEDRRAAELPDPDDAPKIDHRGHLLRIALDLAQIVAIVGALVSLVRTGISAVTGVAIVLTVVLLRTPRPPLPGDDR
jgi:hypothetical protein